MIVNNIGSDNIYELCKVNKTLNTVLFWVCNHVAVGKFQGEVIKLLAQCLRNVRTYVSALCYTYIFDKQDSRTDVARLKVN